MSTFFGMKNVGITLFSKQWCIQKGCGSDEKFNVSKVRCYEMFKTHLGQERTVQQLQQTRTFHQETGVRVSYETKG